MLNPVGPDRNLTSRGSQAWTRRSSLGSGSTRARTQLTRLRLTGQSRCIKPSRLMPVAAVAVAMLALAILATVLMIIRVMIRVMVT